MDEEASPTAGGTKVRLAKMRVDAAQLALSPHHDRTAEESTACRHWDPAKLLDFVYKVHCTEAFPSNSNHFLSLQLDYSPRKESKANRFVNMEGHMDHLPLGVKQAFLEKQWKTQYFRTKEGKLQWFQQVSVRFSDLICIVCMYLICIVCTHCTC